MKYEKINLPTCIKGELISDAALFECDFDKLLLDVVELQVKNYENQLNAEQI